MGEKDPNLSGQVPDHETDQPNVDDVVDRALRLDEDTVEFTPVKLPLEKPAENPQGSASRRVREDKTDRVIQMGDRLKPRK